MATKNNGIINLKTIVAETVLTILIFAVSSCLTALLLTYGKIAIDTAKLILMISIFLSSAAADVLIRVSGKFDINTSTEIISAISLVALALIAALCQKGREVESMRLIISALLLFAGRVIPNVIKSDKRKRKRTKAKK